LVIQNDPIHREAAGLQPKQAAVSGKAIRHYASGAPKNPPFIRSVSRLLMSLAALTFCSPTHDARAQETTSAESMEIRVPDGTPVLLRLAESLSSQQVAKKKVVRLTVSEPVIVQNATVIAQGAPATARIVDAKRAGGFGKSGLLEIEARDVVAVDGTYIPLYFRETESLSNEKTWLSTYRPSDLFSLFFLPVVIGVSGAKQGSPLSLPEGSTYQGYVGIEAAEMNAKRHELTNSSAGERPIRFSLWLQRDINIGGIRVDAGEYTAAFVRTGSNHGIFALLSMRGLFHKLLAITSVEVESDRNSAGLRSVEYTNSIPNRLFRIRSGKFSLCFHEAFVVIHAKGGSQ
jgi:hypothetical protein